MAQKKKTQQADITKNPEVQKKVAAKKKAAQKKDKSLIEKCFEGNIEIGGITFYPPNTQASFVIRQPKISHQSTEIACYVMAYILSIPQNERIRRTNDPDKLLEQTCGFIDSIPEESLDDVIELGAGAIKRFLDGDFFFRSKKT